MVISIQIVIKACTAFDIPPSGLLSCVTYNTLFMPRACGREWLVDKGFRYDNQQSRVYGLAVKSRFLVGVCMRNGETRAGDAVTRISAP